MAKLPKSIIKKHGISKKAWQVFRSRQKSRSKSVRRTNKMAKKRRSVRRRSTGLKPMQVFVGGGMYGAVRRYLDGLVKPITARVPLGSIADEAALFGLGYLAHKNMRDKTIKQVAMAGMAVEAARIGEAISDGSAFAMSNGSSGGAGVSFSTLG